MSPLIYIPAEQLADLLRQLSPVYFSTIIATPLAIACIFLIPDPKTIRHVEKPPVALEDGVEVAADRQPRMDYLVGLDSFRFSSLLFLLHRADFRSLFSFFAPKGTFLQTAAIVLLIFGLTQANGKCSRSFLMRSRPAPFTRASSSLFALTLLFLSFAVKGWVVSFLHLACSAHLT